MKITHFVGRFNPYSSIKKNLIFLAQGVVEKGFETEIYTTYPLTAKVLPEGLKKRIDLHVFPCILRLRKFQVSRSLIHALSKVDADLIHALGYRSFETLCASFLRKRKEIPLVISPYGSVPYVFTFKEKFFKIAQDLITMKSPLRIADIILAETDFEKRCLMNLGINEQKIEVIYESVDTEKFSEEKLTDFSVKKIFYVGRITQLKGIDVLLKAYALLAPSLKRDSEICIAGPIVDRGYYRKLIQLISELKIEDKVRFLGPIVFEELPKIYQSAYVLVLPSFYENIGGVLIEAMACGCPVIASDVGGIPEIVEDAVTGFLFRAGGSKDLAERLTLVLSSESLRRRIAAQARRSAENKYSVQAYLERVLSAYTKAIRISA